MNWSLSTKILVALFAFGLIPFLGLSIYTLVSNNQEANQTIEKEMHLFLDKSEETIHTFFEELTRNAQVISEKNNVIALCQYMNQPDRTIEDPGYIQQRISADNDLHSFASIHNYVIALTMDNSGRVIAHNTKAGYGQNLMELEYVKTAFTGSLGVSSIYKAKTTDDIILSVAYPIYTKDDTHNKVGAVILAASTQYIQTIISKGLEAIGKTADSYLLDVDGTFLTQPAHLQATDVLHAKNGSVIARKFHEEVQANQSHDNHLDYYNNYHDTAVLGLLQVLELEEQHFGLVLEVETQEIFAHVIGELIILCIIIGIIVVLLIVLGIILTRSIVNPIKNIILTLQDSSAQISASAQEMNAASQKLASGASQQASALEESTASVQQISDQIQTNLEHINQAYDTMNESNVLIHDSHADMNHLSASMKDINETTTNMRTIIKDIDEIAFQTNLLSLNAAVEAARAGEAGKGFAVVADEVRNLAQRSAVAAKNTTELIDDTVHKIGAGTELTNQVENSFNSVVGKITTASELITEINHASKEQAQGIQEISHAMNEMEEVVQSNAAGAEETASSVEELHSQVNVMYDMIDDLTEILGAKSLNQRDAKTNKQHNDQEAKTYSHSNKTDITTRHEF